MSKAFATCQKLKTFWRKTDTPISWKLQVYNAVIISQLVYGLNSLNITPAIKNRLDAFHMRGLRYILNIEHTYYSRISNKDVIEQMNLHLNSAEHENITWEQFMIDKEFKREDYKSTKLVGDIILDRQMALLGHIIRREPHELCRRVALDENLQRPSQLYKRVGATRLDWVTDNLARAHSAFHDENHLLTYNPQDVEHVQNLINCAKNYDF